MGCECYTIGGPWISEDPDCPTHGDDARRRQAEEEAKEAEVVRLRLQVQIYRQMAADYEEILDLALMPPGVPGRRPRYVRKRRDHLHAMRTEMETVEPDAKPTP